MARAKSRKSSAKGQASQGNQQQARGRVSATTQQRLEGGQRNQRKRVKSNRSPWILVGGVVVVVVVIVGIFLLLSRQSSSSGGSSTQSTQASPVVMQAVKNVDPMVSAAVGNGRTTPPSPVNGQPPLTGNDGKPLIFYDGAEFCPYCAAERWGVVVALNRFGTFSTLNVTTSSASDSFPNTNTFTFYQSTYQSSYIDFLAVEETTNQLNSSGTDYTPLQTPTAQEQQILNTFNPQGIPFMDIANKFTVTSPGYSPQVLQNLSWDTIAHDLSDAQSPVTQGIIGTANYLTAAICIATNQQPASVCTADPIPQLEQALGKSAVGAGGLQASFALYRFEAITPRTKLVS